MKVTGSVTLMVHGKEMTFSEQELIAILEQRFPKPTEDQWFEVDFQSINRSLFEEKRKDDRQEKTRKMILEAFEKVEEMPEVYAKKFETMMPKKTWDEKKTVEELYVVACELGGDFIAEWVHQALEWAQRICNGESWEDVCNNADTANWYRLVQWKDYHFRLIGGARYSSDGGPASSVSIYVYEPSDSGHTTVPLVVRHKK